MYKTILGFLNKYKSWVINDLNSFFLNFIFIIYVGPLNPFLLFCGISMIIFLFLKMSYNFLKYKKLSYLTFFEYLFHIFSYISFIPVLIIIFDFLFCDDIWIKNNFFKKEHEPHEDEELILFSFWKKHIKNQETFLLNDYFASKFFLKW